MNTYYFKFVVVWLVMAVSIFAFSVNAQNNQMEGHVDTGVDFIEEDHDAGISTEEMRVQVRRGSSRQLFFTATSSVREPLYYLDEGNAFPINSAFRMLADPVFLNGSRTVTLARSYEDEQGVTQYQSLASVELSDGVRHAIIVIIPREGNGSPEYTLLAFDHGLSAHPMNTARFINISPREILVQMDTENFTIQPFEDAVKRVGTSQTHLTMRAGIIIRQEGRVLDTSRQQFRQGTRVLFLGFPDVRQRYGTVFTVVRHRDLGPPE